MAKVIDLSGRKKLKEDLDKADKLESLQGLLRCGECAMKCSKCGYHGEPTKRVTHPGTGVAFNLCSACSTEYQDLVAYLEKGQVPEMPSWFNREWVRLWMAWLDYQWALSNYRSSPEVLAVLTELQNK